MFITGKIRQLIVSELSGEIARGALIGLLSLLSNNPETAGGICGVDFTEIILGLLGQESSLVEILEVVIKIL
jgi:CRP-like cAMP-binding protein